MSLFEQMLHALMHHTGKGSGIEADPKNQGHEGEQGDHFAQAEISNQRVIRITGAAIGDLLEHAQHVGGG